MRELLVATKNKGKFREISEILEGLPFVMFFLGDLEVDDKDFAEDGETFKENAFKKASYYANKLGMLTLAEDSGIFIDALSGELGVKTRRWGAGERASDREWLDFFMKKMEGISDRSAQFVCNACLIGDGAPEFAMGETRGVITEGLRAPIYPGIPLSSCFLPEGYSEVYALLTVDEKNRISHRGKAISQIRAYLEAKT